MAKQRPGIMVYFELLDEMSELSDEECGLLFRDMLVYAQYGVLPSYSDRAMRTLWKIVQTRLDADATRYDEIAAKRAEAGKKGGRPPKSTETEPKQLEAKKPNAFLEKQKNPTTATTTTTATTKSVSAYKPYTPARFVKPTVEEVRGYCNERKNGIDPQRFIDYYEANGWVQSRGTPIKDWKAALRTWESNDRGSLAPKAEKIQAGYSSSDVVEYPEGSGRYVRRDEIPGGMSHAV